MDNQQGPTVEHRELYSIFYYRLLQPIWENNLKKNEYVYMYK